jgi:hypothetical protein
MSGYEKSPDYGGPEFNLGRTLFWFAVVVVGMVVIKWLVFGRPF